MHRNYSFSFVMHLIMRSAIKTVHFRVRYDRLIKEVKTPFLQP